MGRLTKDPEVRHTQEGTAIARYSLAVDRMKKDEADFLPCVVFGKGAEFAEKYLKKGTKICVVGRIQTGSYTNREGNKVYTTDIIIEQQEFAESKKQEEAPEPAPVDGFVNVPDSIPDDQLPFH